MSSAVSKEEAREILELIDQIDQHPDGGRAVLKEALKLLVPKVSALPVDNIAEIASVLGFRIGLLHGMLLAERASEALPGVKLRKLFKGYSLDA